MATTRRAHGEGHIRQRADGRWEGSIELPGGTRRRRKFVYGTSEEEVTLKLLKVRLQLTETGLVPDDRLTVGAFLQEWLDWGTAVKWRPRTVRSYRAIVEDHITPHLGRVPLAKLGPAEVDRWLAALARQGVGLRTADYARSVLRAALNRARRQERIVRNAAALSEPVGYRRRKVQPPTVEQAQRILTATIGHRFEAPIWLMLGLGLRSGEALGLQWGDVDLTAAIARVQNQLQRDDKGKWVLVPPKSQSGERVLRIPPPVLIVLRRQQRRIAIWRAAARHWSTTFDLVCPATHGGPIEPRNLCRAWHQLLAREQLPRFRLHDLRHAMASYLLHRRIPLHEVSKALGHSQPTLTLSTYAHLIEGLGPSAADTLGGVLLLPPGRARQES